MARLSHFPSEVTRLSVKPVICENGARIVLDSREAEEVSVVESLECDLDRGSPVSEIRNLSEMLLSCSESIRKELERRLNRPVTQLQLPPKKYMATVDVPFDQLSGERVPQQILLEVIFQFLPTSVRKLIEEKQILISSSRNAIDIHLPIRKIDGVRFLLKKYGVERTKIAYIGDAESDIEGLVYAHVGCCPANADGPVKRCVRQKGRLGYVSPFSYAEGVADSLKWIRTRVPDMYMCGATEQDRGV
jgi:hydroxymethylpyrimidine pyrophosphatase-like HAD family hydrolase